MEMNAFQPQILIALRLQNLLLIWQMISLAPPAPTFFLQKAVRRQNTETELLGLSDLFEINCDLRLWKCFFLNAALAKCLSQATSRLLGLYLKALTSLMLSNLLNDSFFAYQRQTLPCMLAKPDLILNLVLILWSWYFQQCKTTNHSIFIMIREWYNFLRK